MFFLAPVGMEEGVATVPNRILRCEATSWGNCHICLSQVSLGSSWAHQTPPMATATNLEGAAAKVCSSLPLLAWKKVLQQFQTGCDVVKPLHGAIAFCLSQVSLWELLGPPEPPMATARNLDGAAAKVCSSLPLLVWKKVLQQFQTGCDLVKPRHGAIAICLSQMSLGSS